MEVKKSSRFDVEGRKKYFFQIGMALALSFVLVAFEWAQFEEIERYDNQEVVDIGDEVEIIPITYRKNPPPPPPPISKAFQTEASTSRFLGKATFGASLSEINRLTNTEVSDWIKAEFEKPRILFLPGLLAEENALPDGDHIHTRRLPDVVLDAAIGGDDQLRQRMVLALSEIMVVSNVGELNNYPLPIAHYADLLSENAFGNFRDLMEDVTYSPAMGVYLTYIANRKGDPATGRMPDENYARELLQLFTIGLVELNMDGTPKLDGAGEPIEIFDNDDITGLAKVFTGLSLNHIPIIFRE